MDPSRRESYVVVSWETVLILAIVKFSFAESERILLFRPTKLPQSQRLILCHPRDSGQATSDVCESCWGLADIILVLPWGCQVGGGDSNRRSGKVRQIPS